MGAAARPPFGCGRYRPSERQISHWSLRRGDEIVAQRQGFDERSPYQVCVSGAKQAPRQIGWRGLMPGHPDNLADSVRKPSSLGPWPLFATRSPASPTRVEHSPRVLGPNQDELRKSVREWYRRTFGVSIDVVAQGIYSGARRQRATRAIGSGALACSARGDGGRPVRQGRASTSSRSGGGAPSNTRISGTLASWSRPASARRDSLGMFLLRARRWIAEAAG